MKQFTFNDIKEFCKNHFMEYMGEAETAIVIKFIDDEGYVRAGFLDLCNDTAEEVSGVWLYVDYDMFGENRYMFNFKRIA